MNGQILYLVCQNLNFSIAMFQTAIAIIKKFCKENPSERLGYQKDGILDIRKHRYGNECGESLQGHEKVAT